MHQKCCGRVRLQLYLLLLLLLLLYALAGYDTRMASACDCAKLLDLPNLTMYCRHLLAPAHLLGPGGGSPL